MKLSRIRHPLQGEKLADVEPAIRQFVTDDSRLARLNFFPGRNLTDKDFQSEHHVRLARLLLRGQAVSPGVVDGLEVGLDNSGTEPFLTLCSGFGLTVSGEDITVDRKLVINFKDLQVFDLAAGKVNASLSDLSRPASKPQAAVLLWQPVSVPHDEIPIAAIPAGFDASFSPADRVPDDEAYYRRNVIDASRLVICFWPEDWRTLPPFSSRWRNDLAWEIFFAESDGVLPPWLSIGLPVALVGLDVNYRPLFVDRGAVVRQGGRPRFRTLREKGGDARLWQARVDQFAAHLTDLADSATGAVNFRYLPPVGLLPKAFLQLDKNPGQWNIRQTFFLSTYLIQIAVAPLEQLDAVFESTRDLDPYDLWQPDSVNLLLPVAQEFFDPQLLKIESVAQEFLDTVNELLDARGVWRARRDDVRAKDTALTKALTAKAPAFPVPDPGQLDPSETASTDPLNPPEETYGTTESDGQLSVEALEELNDALGKYLITFDSDDLAARDQYKTDTEVSAYFVKQENIQLEEANALSNLGLRGFIDYLTAKADQADNLLDSGFLHVNSNIYNLGQLLNNNAIGTRFATSPSLASNVVRQTAPVTGAANLFASRVFADLGSTEPAAPLPPPVTLMRAAGPSVIPSSVATSVNPIFLGRLNTGPLTNVISAGEVLTSDTGQAQLARLDQAVANDPEAQAALNNLKKASVVQSDTLTGLKNLSAFADAYVPNFNSVTPNQIRAIPLDRLAAPDSSQARQNLFDTKLEIFAKLMQLNISLAHLTTDFVDRPNANPDAPFANLKFHDVILPRVVDQLDKDADETVHFSVATKHADMSIAAMRAVEGRIKLYRDLIALCQQKLAIIEGNLSLLEGRLKAVDDGLDEARHDVAVAQALLAEETARVAGINAHREQVLREHVTFVMFHRPRAVEARDETPVRVIEPALRSEPVPDCLAQDLPLPPDLSALATVFRDSPARWFKYAPAWIGQVNRLDQLHDLMVRSLERTATFIASPPAASNGRYATALNKVFASRLQLSTNFLPALTAVNPASLAALSWVNLSQRAQSLLTLGHLIDAGPANLARTAAAELNNIFKVGACLHRDFSQVLPFLRLLWAERYSQFDGPADFRNLSILPRWNEVPFTLRREMQIDTDWLYSRMDAQQPDALDLIHDLIRVALLLASHAPADQLITGALAEVTTPVPGGVIKVRVDPLRVRVGMNVVVEKPAAGAPPSALVRGVVEDIAADQVIARVTTVPIVSKLEPANVTVRFQESASYIA
jgi:hypothetical protein